MGQSYGQPQGGWQQGGGFGRGPNYGSAFGAGGYPGSRSYQNAWGSPSVSMSVDNNWYERGQGMPPTQGPVSPVGGIPQPQMSVDNNWYERGQGLPQAPKAPSNPSMPAGAGNPNYAPGGVTAATDPSAFNKPAMSTPFGESQSMPTRQAPPGYYFAPNGQMLLGQDPAKAAAPNAFGGTGTGAPYDPRTPGYQPGAGWQTMLRQYAMGDGVDPNQYVQDRGLNPMWGNARQPWEPESVPGGMGLSQLLQRFRGF